MSLDLSKEPLTPRIQEYAVVVSFEEGGSHELLERLDAPRQRRRRQRKRVGGGLERAKPRHLDEGLDRSQRRKAFHPDPCAVQQCNAEAYRRARKKEPPRRRE